MSSCSGALPCGLGSALRSDLSLESLSVLGFAEYLSSLKMAQGTPNVVFLWRPGLRPPFLEVCPSPSRPKDPSHVLGPQESAGKASALHG